jgi:transglutaminase/protease-like cytokinesis protein 3
MALDSIESSLSSAITLLALSLWAVMMATFFVSLHVPQDEITQTQILAQATAMDNEMNYIDPVSGNRYLINSGIDNSTDNNKAGKITANYSNYMVLPTSLITTSGPDENFSVNTHYIIRSVPLILNESGAIRYQSWTVQAGYDSFKPQEQPQE